jgi:NADPH2:quinone reductase
MDTNTKTYRAIMLTAKGGPEVLKPVELPVTEPKAGEVRLRVLATGAGATDVTMRRGYYLFAPKIPFVPGYEVVGEIEAMSGEAQASGLRLGQRMAALIVHGGYAEKIVLPGSALVPVPDAVSDADAVALILNYVTAYQSIHRVARMERGQSALVTGASGGVGSAVLELLRLAGVNAIGAASPARHGLIRSLGATPIDGRGAPLPPQVRAIVPAGVDVAFDGLGGRFVGQCVSATRRGGSIVAYGFSGAQREGKPDYIATARGALSLLCGARLRGRHAHFYGITKLYRDDPQPFREDLSILLALCGAGQLKPKIHLRLPLLAASEAGALLERGGIEGKIVHLAGV